MKYYLWKGQVNVMEDRLWPHLLKNEQGIVELTKQEYENRLSGGVKPVDPDGGSSLETYTEKEVVAPFSGTKAEAEEILKRRGFTSSMLRGKRKQDLIDMI